VVGDGKSVSVSPIGGKITAHTATLGGFVQPQTELFRVAGNGPAQVEAAVASTEISRITAGDQATIVTTNGTPVIATVRSVTPPSMAPARRHRGADAEGSQRRADCW
jgi:cobalt-zinc-cadmium efflux system membrane fusion protein